MMVGYDYARSSLQQDRGRARSARLRGCPKHLAVLLTVFLVSGIAARADDGPSAVVAASPDPGTPAGQFAPGPLYSGNLPVTWQFSGGYEYQQPYLKGAYPPFNTNGFDASAVRYFTRFVGVEGNLGAGFGSYEPGESFTSIFFGGGLHVVYHNRTRIEPWAHGLIGGSYYHFELPQPAVLKDAALSWVIGGGIDYRLHVPGRVAIRIEGDYFGSHFGGVFQKDPQAVAGLVWNF